MGWQFSRTRWIQWNLCWKAHLAIPAQRLLPTQKTNTPYQFSFASCAWSPPNQTTVHPFLPSPAAGFSDSHNWGRLNHTNSLSINRQWWPQPAREKALMAGSDSTASPRAQHFWPACPKEIPQPLRLEGLVFPQDVADKLALRGSHSKWERPEGHLVQALEHLSRCSCSGVLGSGPEGYQTSDFLFKHTWSPLPRSQTTGLSGSFCLPAWAHSKNDGRTMFATYLFLTDGLSKSHRTAVV